MWEEEGKRSKGDILWWNEEMKEAVSLKKGTDKVMCQNIYEENKRRFKSMKNKAYKAVSTAMREKAEEALTELKHGPNAMFRLVKRLNFDEEVEGGSDGKLCFSEKECGIIWKIMWKGS